MGLIKDIQNCKVSSVLNGDKQMYGKKFLFDGSDETCWNSDKGCPQKIDVHFTEPKIIRRIKIQFQGGFAAKQMSICSRDDNQKSDALVPTEMYPLDTNQVQEFKLESPISTQSINLTFKASYDFYGRIIIYHLEFYDE